MARQSLVWAAVMLTVAATAGGFGYHKYVEISAALAAAETLPEPRDATETVRVVHGEWPAPICTSGTVVTLRHVEIRNENGGTVIEIGFASGDIVDAGQVRVGLGTRQAPASLATARAEARLAEVVFIGAAGCVPVQPAPPDLAAHEELRHGDREQQPISTWLQVRLHF